MKDYAARMEELYELIERHARLYYEQDSPEISDAEYDSLVRELSELEHEYPNSAKKDFLTHRVGGSPSELFAKIRHRTPMLSLDNVFNSEELASFFERIKKESAFTCEMKIDGLAVSLVYEDGVFVRGATRGDGQTGEDVTENLLAINSIPKKLKGTITGVVEVRGEVLMKLSRFNSLNQQREEEGEAPFANPRNAAAGTLRQSAKNNRVISKRGLDFFAYYLVDAEAHGVKKQGEALTWLAEHGLPVQSAWKCCESLKEVNDFIKNWQDERYKLDYVTDGVVVKFDDLTQWGLIGATSHAPRWAVAFKYPPEEARTKILDIKISIGRTGALTPVAILEPVRLAGTIVQRAGLHNADEIARKDVRVGDVVRVRKAAEIIPEVIAVDKEARTGDEKFFAMPERCSACNSEIIKLPEEVAYRCPNRASCPAQLKEGLKYFASRNGMNIRGIGKKLASQLIESNKIKFLSDIYELEPEDWAGLERMGGKSAQNIMSELEKSKARPLSSFIAALGIRYVGKNAAELLANHFKNLDALRTACEEEVADIPGIGPVIARSVRAFFDDEANLELLERFKKLGVIVSGPVETNISNELAGKTFVFTGTLAGMTRDEAAKKVKSMGGNVSGSVSAKTDYLVAGDNPGSKLDKAIKLGVKVINEEDFLLIGSM